MCGDRLLWLPLCRGAQTGLVSICPVVDPGQERPTLIGVHTPWQAKILLGVPHYGRIHSPALKKQLGSPPRGGVLR